jgi:hypothetical protein
MLDAYTATCSVLCMLLLLPTHYASTLCTWALPGHCLGLAATDNSQQP